jgi:hypothetical protein
MRSELVLFSGPGRLEEGRACVRHEVDGCFLCFNWAARLQRSICSVRRMVQLRVGSASYLRARRDRLCARHLFAALEGGRAGKVPGPDGNAAGSYGSASLSRILERARAGRSGAEARR